MLIRRNQAAVDAVVRASFRDTPANEMKELYIQQNIFDVDPDQPVYRVTAESFLIDDISNGYFTHTRINKNTWLDNLENPLLDLKFPDEVTRGTVDLNGVVENMFGVCWTEDPTDSELAWNNFSHGRPSVRIQSTPRKILSAVMQIGYTFYMLHHHIGKVEYAEAEKIRKEFEDPDYEKHLDSLGQGAVLSLMQLRSAVSVEREVRLIYSYMPSDSWVEQHVELDGDFCKVPFVWSNVIDEIIVGPHIPKGGEALLKAKLRLYNIRCPIISSVHRYNIG